MEQPWQTVGRKGGKGAPVGNASPMSVPLPLLCEEVLKGFASGRIKALIEWSRSQNSPVTGAPCHAQKHSVDQAKKSSNYYGVLANTDRRAHSLTDDDFLEKVVGVALGGPLGHAVLSFACPRAPRGAQRIVFHLPASLALMGGAQVHMFTNAQYGGASEAQDAVLIIDLDTAGRLYVLTGFASVTLPPDQRQTAGGRDCAFINGGDVLWVLQGNKVHPELIGGKTYVDGEKYTRL